MIILLLNQIVFVYRVQIYVGTQTLHLFPILLEFKPAYILWKLPNRFQILLTFKDGQTDYSRNLCNKIL